MKLKLQSLLFITFLLIFNGVFAQDVSLYQQFNGRYDFVFVGNTLNTAENGSGAPCTILTSSSATLNINPGDQIISAYLYWAGSGTGDFDIKLNGTDISATRDFPLIQVPSGRSYFSAFADVTNQVIATGGGVYTVSELDLTAVIAPYCPTGGNFGGWAIVIVFENAALPLNQVNIYDGMQAVPDQLSIVLSNLNVIDNDGAKLGFVAWEGDRSLAVNETLTINGNIVGNPPFNPSTNAFNGTNSFTNATTLYNMDLDVYDIQGYISVGDESAEIGLTSGQDFVMINAVVTKLNSQLPDATILVDNPNIACDSRNIFLNYTVYNSNATQPLPALVRIAFYANGVLVGTAQTQNIIPIGSNESGQISLVIPDTIPDNFELIVVVDDNGLGEGDVKELSETNNGSAPELIAFLNAPELMPLPLLYSCNQGLTKGTFDFSSYIGLLQTDSNAEVSFYESESDAQYGTNPILNPENYTADATPQTIFARVDNGSCFKTTSFVLNIRNCPPIVYNYISANNDGLNDDFFIEGLRDVFVNFKLSVYNRWGQLIWIGDNQSPNWEGINNKGFIPNAGISTDGTYFYVLELNDADYPNPITGFLYFTKT